MAPPKVNFVRVIPKKIATWLWGITAIVAFAPGCAGTVQPCDCPSLPADSDIGIVTTIDTQDTENADTGHISKAEADTSLQIPLCGVLSEKGYATITFLVPDAVNQSSVFRFEVIDHDQMMPPPAVEAGWWICVVEGEILSQPAKAHPDAYGKIRIDKYISDESNGEKGQE